MSLKHDYTKYPKIWQSQKNKKRYLSPDVGGSQVVSIVDGLKDCMNHFDYWCASVASNPLCEGCRVCRFCDNRLKSHNMRYIGRSIYERNNFKLIKDDCSDYAARRYTIKVAMW